jgi:lysophospholipase L1-like esterase
LIGALLVTALGACGGGGSSGSEGTWVGTWSSAPLCFGPATLLGLPRDLEFNDQSVRMVVHTSIGGERVRVRLSNECGREPLEIAAASVGIREAGASIRPGTERTLTFETQSSVAIPAGATATSDPVDLELTSLEDLTITIYLPGRTAPTTSQPLAALSYLSEGGDFTDAIDDTPFQTQLRHWVFLDAVEVFSRDEASAVVAFGDSVTEGTGTTFAANRRWPDFLSRRFVAAGKNIGVLNEGINGNKLLNSLLGDSALLRFDEDVLGHAGVKYVVLLEGINDIGTGSPDVTAAEMIEGYRDLIRRAHEAGLEIFGGTLTPAEHTPFSFYEPYEESKRVEVNRFIRESGEFDAVFDFAAAVSDPDDPTRWRDGFSIDQLHPSDAAAEAMANVVDLSLFD